MPIISSISGLRATLSDKSMSESLIKNYANAFDKYCGVGKIVIGRDGRPSGEWVEKYLYNEFRKLGREILSIGIVPSPTVQLITELEYAAGGISITASHNPEDWNGLKFINSDGVFLDEKENKIMWSFLKNDDDGLKNEDLMNNAEIDFFENEINQELLIANNEKAISRHVKKVLDLNFLNSDKLNKLRKKQLKIVVDASNASGSNIVPMLLKELGCKVINLYCEGNGVFPHLPEPLPINLLDLAKSVKENDADLGIAVDPDADRLVLIDENGDPIGEENTIVLSVQSLLSQLNENIEKNVVVNHSTTMAVEYVAKKYSGNVFRSPVGEINVVRKMQKVGAVIGGEGSGGVILSDCHYGRDSLVGIGLILSLIANTDKKLSHLKNELPKYQMLKTKFDFSGNFDKLSEKISAAFSDCNIILEDGLKIINENSWVQIRKSNTEPIVRIISEAENEIEAKDLIEKIKNNLEN